MKKYIIAGILELLIMGIYYYFALPAINIQTISFWVFIVIAIGLFVFLFSIAYAGSEVIKVSNKKVILVNYQNLYLYLVV